MIQDALPYSSHHLDLSQLIPPPGFLFRPHTRLHSSLSHFSALIPARQWHPQAHLMHQLSGPGFITGRRSAGRVRYLAALTSWRGIYADDDSHCPLAILLLPLCRSVQSPATSTRLGSRRGLPSFSFLSLYHTSCLQKTFGSHLSLGGGLCRRIVSPFVRQSLLSQQSKRLEAKSSRLITLILWLSQPFLRGAY